METTGTKAPPDEVDEAAAATKKAVGRLARLLGDEDRAVLLKAASALAEIGPFAVGPLAAALPRASSPRHRLAIMGALLSFGDQAYVQVAAALTAAIKREKDPFVRAKAGAALAHLIAGAIAADLAAGAIAPRATGAAR